MKNELKVFNNEEFGNVRVVEINGEGWLVAKDVSDILGYAQTSNMLKRIDDEDFMSIKLNNMNMKSKLINTSGLYSAIIGSNVTPSSKKEALIKWLELIGFKNEIPLISRKEIEFLDLLENVLEPFNFECIRQYRVLNYRIDYYISSLNIAIEYDENGHNGYTYEAHIGRQKEIEEELGCRFIRVTDKESDGYNVGLVLKELMEVA